MTKRQRRFLEYYIETGDKCLAYERAYPKAKSERVIKAGARRLLENEEVKEMLSKIKEKEVADKEEILKFWTSILRDETTDKSIRLEASKLLRNKDYFLGGE